MTVDTKSSEISAVQELIEMLDVDRLIITTDTMNCQKKTAEKIVENKKEIMYYK